MYILSWHSVPVGMGREHTIAFKPALCKHFFDDMRLPSLRPPPRAALVGWMGCTHCPKPYPIYDMPLPSAGCSVAAKMGCEHCPKPDPIKYVIRCSSLCTPSFLQAALVRPVSTIRRKTAARTDERVRLAGEVINGALAMKMLSWEVRVR